MLPDQEQFFIIVMENILFCNMNALFSFDLFMVYIQECKQQILYTLNLGCRFIILRDLCNNQRPRSDITWP